MLQHALPVILLLLTAAGAAAAQSASATLSTTIPPLARLTFSRNTLVFPDADPDLVPQVPATGGPLVITAKARGARDGVTTLTVLANDDLRSGVTVLPAATITWTGSGPGFVGGTLNRTASQ